MTTARRPKARRKARRREIEPLGTVLGRDHTFRKLVDTDGLPISQHDWEVAVGSRIAARARPYRLEGGVLSILAATAAWSQELSLLSDRIILQLGRLGIEVTTLRFKVGKVESPARASRLPPKVEPPLAVLPNPLAREIAKVEDPDLRQAIARAARRALGFENR